MRVHQPSPVVPVKAGYSMGIYEIFLQISQYPRLLHCLYLWGIDPASPLTAKKPTNNCSNPCFAVPRGFSSSHHPETALLLPEWDLHEITPVPSLEPYIFCTVPPSPHFCLISMYSIVFYRIYLPGIFVLYCILYRPTRYCIANFWTLFFARYILTL